MSDKLFNYYQSIVADMKEELLDAELPYDETSRQLVYILMESLRIVEETLTPTLPYRVQLNVASRLNQIGAQAQDIGSKLRAKNVTVQNTNTR